MGDAYFPFDGKFSPYEYREALKQDPVDIGEVAKMAGVQPQEISNPRGQGNNTIFDYHPAMTARDYQP